MYLVLSHSLIVALLLKKQHGLMISGGYFWLELGTEEV